jgi:glycerol-3-phosphate O-acyltransferase / dihydroxyacetone phosphate acyltransferase
MKAILHAFYRFLQVTLGFSFQLYFKNIFYINKKGLRESGPLIVVSNHPNTLFDPLVITVKTKEIVYFLANASLFKSKIGGAILNTLYTIPIQRPQDVGGAMKLNNKESFDRCDNFLNEGGSLYVAPEGTSFVERELRDVKTGTARIALSAAAKNNFTSNIKVLPIGLIYDAPNHFRSNLIVNCGTPIVINNYKEEYNQDLRSAVKNLTSEIENALSELMINCNIEEESFLKNIELLKWGTKPFYSRANFFESKSILNKLRTLDETKRTSLEEKLKAYLDKIASKNINIDTIVKKSNPLVWFFLPVFIVGYVLNLALIIPIKLLTKKLNLYIGYNSTVKFLSAMVFIPIYYGLLTYFLPMVNGFLGFLGITISGILLGIAAFYLKGEYQLFFERLHNRKQLIDLEKERLELLSLLNESFV